MVSSDGIEIAPSTFSICMNMASGIIMGSTGATAPCPSWAFFSLPLHASVGMIIIIMTITMMIIMMIILITILRMTVIVTITIVIIRIIMLITK